MTKRTTPQTLARIGNAEYARENASYGLTTLRKRHVTIRSGHVRPRFTGKSGIEHDVAVEDPRVGRIVRRWKCAPRRGGCGWMRLHSSRCSKRPRENSAPRAGSGAAQRAIELATLRKTSGCSSCRPARRANCTACSTRP